MHGNIWEWCADHWHDNYEGAIEDGSAWIDEELNENDNRSQKSRVLRGGSWVSNPGSCRSAYRNNHVAGNRNLFYGVRVVCTVA